MWVTEKIELRLRDGTVTTIEAQRYGFWAYYPKGP